ncbi:hypothetical protein GCM10007242_03040 [Pigmentiphaga litoralis]|jgi:Zn-dependent protease with chaperone function|uniref:M48 family metalloprotease n=1 Tax=Pigmentiphaga litoralis TaxID=516702 RepID=UPI001672B2B9|nr:M48 family metalloprotease [Pigmentiphaga litoralis]GGX01532.1 hypothetical protein GCM10007242_03040 [Pigmentiphaga litoralis]
MTTVPSLSPASIAVSLASILLTSCATVPAGWGKADPAAGPQPSATPTPSTSPGTTAKPARVEPWMRPAAGRPFTAPRKPPVALTNAGDLTCTQLVAPFELTTNFEMLQNLGTEGIQVTLTEWWERYKRNPFGGAAGQAIEKSAKHNIPYQLRAAAYQMNWVPMELEVAYGEELARQLQAAGEIEPLESESGPKLYAAADKLLLETLAGVNEPHAYTFKAVVTTRPGKNAEALPGGLVLIDPALLDDPTLARKARFAMAHEIGHVLQRHQTRAMQARIIDTVSLKGSLPDLARVMGESKSSPKAVVTLLLAGKLQFEKFYVEQELHSDGCAVRVLNRTQPSAPEMVRVVQEFVAGLPKVTGSKGEPPLVAMSSARSTVSAVQKSAKDAESLIDMVTRPVERHPTTTERVKNLNQTLDKLRLEARPGPAPKTR